MKSSSKSSNRRGDIEIKMNKQSVKTAKGKPVARKKTKRKKATAKKIAVVKKSASTAPVKLTGLVARNEWDKRIGWGFDGDSNLLASYCDTLQRIDDATAGIAKAKEKNPTGGGLVLSSGGKLVANPLVAIKETAERHAITLGKALGFKPDKDELHLYEVKAGIRHGGGIW